MFYLFVIEKKKLPIICPRQLRHVSQLIKAVGILYLNEENAMETSGQAYIYIQLQYHSLLPQRRS
jgi:hypothetical protein